MGRPAVSKHTVFLIAAKDEDTGELGLVIEGTTPAEGTLNSASDGLLIAHDIIEHVNGPERIGTIDDELEALGAIWYVRGKHGQLRKDGVGSFYSIEDNIASDVERMFRDYFYGQSVTIKARYTRPHDHDDAFKCIIETARKRWPREFEAKERSEALKLWRGYASAALHLMRTGYRKAHRRWEHRGRYAANKVFWAIAEAVGCYARGAQYEGQRFKLTYHTDGSAFCDEVYEDE